jgi:hypothetical protein
MYQFPSRIRFQDIFGKLDLKLALENLIKCVVDLEGLPRPERDRHGDPDILTNGDQDRAGTWKFQMYLSNQAHQICPGIGSRTVLEGG